MATAAAWQDAGAAATAAVVVVDFVTAQVCSVTSGCLQLGLARLVAARHRPFASQPLACRLACASNARSATFNCLQSDRGMSHTGMSVRAHSPCFNLANLSSQLRGWGDKVGAQWTLEAQDRNGLGTTSGA